MGALRVFRSGIFGYGVIASPDYGFTAEVAEPSTRGTEACRGMVIDVDEPPRLRAGEVG